MNLYFVFEYASRGSLLKLIKEVTKSEKMSLDLVKFYAAEILSAIEYTHLKGVVHRDL